MVNEFGDINIDSQLLISLDEDMVELSNGCICCTINEGLVDAVYRVLEREDRIDYLVIETTGIADPLPIALTFLGTELRDLTRLDSILTLVDAETFTPEHFESEAALRQVAYGDMILLNKIDRVDNQRLEELESYIRTVKHGARILRTEYGQVPLPLILDVGLTPIDEYSKEADQHDAHAHEHEHTHENHDPTHDHDHKHHHGHHSHHSHHLENDGFVSVSKLCCEIPMSKQAIDFDKNTPVIANEYDEAAQLALPGYEAMHTMAFACLKSRLPEVANLLVVGAGTGFEIAKYGKAKSNWQILGVDPSSKMLAIAQDRINQSELSQRVQLVQGYTQELPVAPLYDGATCILVMHFLPDDGSKLSLLQSIAQRLKSSAVFVLVDVFGQKGSDELDRMISILKAYWEETGFPTDKSTKLLENFNEGVFPIQEARVLELLQQAGFEDVMRFYTGLWVGGWVATKS